MSRSSPSTSAEWHAADCWRTDFILPQRSGSTCSSGNGKARCQATWAPCSGTEVCKGPGLENSSRRPGRKNGTLTSFKTQVNALAACHIRICMWDGVRAKTVNTQPFSSIDVWFPSSADQKMMWPSTITSSHKFFSTLSPTRFPSTWKP